MVQLNITPDETTILRNVLACDLSDLGYEIANTDRKDFRDGLKEKQSLLRSVLGQLDRQSAGASAETGTP